MDPPDVSATSSCLADNLLTKRSNPPRRRTQFAAIIIFLPDRLLSLFAPISPYPLTRSERHTLSKPLFFIYSFFFPFSFFLLFSPFFFFSLCLWKLLVSYNDWRRRSRYCRHPPSTGVLVIPRRHNPHTLYSTSAAPSTRRQSLVAAGTPRGGRSASAEAPTAHTPVTPILTLPWRGKHEHLACTTPPLLSFAPSLGQLPPPAPPRLQGDS